MADFFTLPLRIAPIQHGVAVCFDDGADLAVHVRVFTWGGTVLSRGLGFGRFEVRLAERQLLADGRPVPIGARAFDVLAALVERRDRVVSKNELLDQAWPGLVVEENNLSVQISALRKVLGAESIATVTGRGYRFALPAQDTPTAQSSPELAGRIARRLTTVVYAEVVGWTRLVERHADAAIAAWRAIRSALIDATVPATGGRVIELAAEGMWIEFASAVDAVRWASDLQKRLADRRGQGDGLPLKMRLGIHVDDLIVDDGKLVGQGARWSAQLLAVALADDAIVVSEAARGFVRHKLPMQWRRLDLSVPHPHTGEPVAVYALESAAGREADAALPQPPLLWAQKPAVAVLPFGTDGGESLYFGDGVTEEIVSTLSANRALLVIARNSTLRYRDSTRSTAEIAAELGVRYLLSGSVRRQSHRLRINVELVDASANRIIWAERYDGADEDLFGFQAQIAASIAAAIDPRVQEAEIARVASRPTDSLSAYDCVLRGLAVEHSFRDGDLALAGEMYRRAIELDPNYAQAHAHLAWWHNLRYGERCSAELSEHGRAAERLSMRAVELDPRDAWVLSVAGHIQAFIGRRCKEAMEMFEQALRLNPSCAVAWARSAITLNYMGDGEQAAQRVRTAMRLSPFDPHTYSYLTTYGTAEMVQGHDDEAVAWYGKARRLNPGYRAAWRMLIAALALSGELAEARELAAEFIRVEPGFRVDAFGAWYPMREPHLGRVLDGMRQAGLPG